MAAFTIGIDTGGTYTDAVIIQPEQRQIRAATKALTTPGNLALGVLQALEQVLAAAPTIEPQQIALVALSTTLATNALVEGKGAPIAIALIGFDDTMLERSELTAALPDAPIIRLAGGHRYDGSEQEPLDEVALLAALEALSPRVQAYAVAGLYSVRNAEHEQRVQALIQQKTACPVTLSCELSDALNGPRRALTAALNARIIGLIVALVNAVRRSLQAKGIQAPLMIVKGDGSLVSADLIIAKPIETILSGPAASVIGASFLAGLSDFLLADIGGTTTDIATVRNGWPALNQQGARVGGYQTMVKAIDMQTLGLGGDSEVAVTHDGKIVLKTNRIVPVSLIGMQWPSVQKALEQYLREGRGSGIASLFVMRPRGTAGLIGTMQTELAADELHLLNDLSEEPKPWSAVVASVRDRYRLMRLYDKGLVQLAGFTPSDAAHVLGLQTQWSKPVADLACLIVGQIHGKVSYNEQQQAVECQAFAQAIVQAVINKSAKILISHLAGFAFAPNDVLVNGVAAGEQQLGDLQVSLRSNLPLVAVGGPAPVFYPMVGQRLGVETVIPEHSGVANAIGAAVGLVRVQVRIAITKAEQGGYHLHSVGKPLWLETPEQVLAQALQLAEQQAKERIQANGGTVIELHRQIQERVDIPDFSGEAGLISAVACADCIGRFS